MTEPEVTATFLWMWRGFAALALLGLVLFAAQLPSPKPPPPPEPAPRESRPPPLSPPRWIRTDEFGYRIYLRERDGMEMVWVPPGDGMLFEGQGEPGRWHVDGFFWDLHEVTAGQFATFLNDTGGGEGYLAAGKSVVRKDGRWVADAPDLPVVGVSPEGARAYAAWVGGSIPTLVERERAAWNTLPRERRAPERELPPHTLVAAAAAPVDSPWGARGCFGNAAEWCLLESSGRHVPCGGSWKGGELRHSMPSPDAEAQTGFRCVVRPIAEPVVGVPWRTDFWEAVREARRRNAVVLLAWMEDGIDAGDRFREGLRRWKGLIELLADGAVPLLAHGSRLAGALGHHPRTDGSCPIYPGLACSQHEAPLEWANRLAPWATNGFFLLNPAAGPESRLEVMVLTATSETPGESEEAWVRWIREGSGPLKDPLPESLYRRQREEFARVEAAWRSGAADPAVLRRIAEDPRAAFREEARLLLRELEKPAAGSDALVRGIGELERAIRDRRFRDAVRTLAELDSAASRNPEPFRRETARARLLEAGWKLLTEARELLRLEQREMAKELYERIAAEFDGTEAARIAREERGKIP